MAPKFGNICGYTQDDVETSFAPYLVNQDYEKIKRWYNGYNFLKNPLYNPFDLLKFIKNDFKYSNYWFASATPTYLIKLIEKNNYFLPNLANLVIGEQILDSFDIDNIDLEVILYQAGYLTIDKVQELPFGGIEYKLKLPNVEVKQSLYDFVIDFLTKNNQPNTYKVPIYQSLININLEEFKTSLTSIFASIPYNNFTNNKIQNYEGFYASVVYVYIQSLGLEIIGEDVTNKGCIDLTIKMDHAIFILEFKVDGKKGEALAQIKNKNYAQKYHHYTLPPTSFPLYLIGIEFNTKEKNISNFEWEKL